MALDIQKSDRHRQSAYMRLSCIVYPVLAFWRGFVLEYPQHRLSFKVRNCIQHSINI